MADKKRVALCLPVFDGYTPTAFTISFRCIQTPFESLVITPTGPAPIDDIRNNLVRKAIEHNCTHILMLDTDQVYPPDVLIRLMAHDLPIVGAKVHRRFPPYDPILYRGEMPNYSMIHSDEWGKGGLIEVDTIGGGCLLVQTEVFKTVPEPWFLYAMREDGKGRIGEDIYFGAKAKEHGYRIFVDCDVKIGHFAHLIITEESFWNYKFDQEITI